MENSNYKPLVQGACTVLIVEDDLTEQVQLRDIIARRYPLLKLYAARDGKEGLALFQQAQPEIVLTDINMPGLDGVGMAEAIRRLAPEVELIILTGSSDYAQIIRCIGIGVSRYVLKPIEIRQLFEALDTSLGRIRNAARQKIAEDALHTSEQRHRDNLAELVRERTAELEARNRQLDQEVKQRQLVEESLRASETRYRALFDNSLDAIFWADSPGAISAANRAACLLFGSTEEELCRAGRAGIVDPDDERVEASVRERDRNGYVRSEVRFKRKDGSVFLAEITSFLLDHNNSYFVMVRDISDRRNAEEKIRELNASLELRVKQRTAELEAAVGELEAFSYSVSHDFRAPLRHINNYSAILAEDFGPCLPSEAHHYLERIGAATTRMGALIDHLLDLSRMGRVPLRKEKVDLGALVRSVAGVLLPDGGTRSLELLVEDGLFADGDPILLRQLLENLVDNAWKYSAGRPVCRLRFGRTTESGEPCFYLSDNGAGFDMAYSQKLFKVFERLHGSEFGGLGIGLATVQRIVERHGGRVWADGSVGQGATFYFTLPQNQPPSNL